MAHFFSVCNNHTITARLLRRIVAGLKNARKIEVVLLGVFTLAGASACQKQHPPSQDSAVTTGASSAESIQEAERLYHDRADLMKVREAIVQLRHAQLTDGGNYEIAWRLAKYDYYLGSHSPNEGEKEIAFRDGIEAGKLAVKLQDGKPDGHFWLGANYGGSAETSTLAGLAEVEDIKGEMETVIKLDEKYEGGSAYMVLGETFLEAPILLGGDRGKAVQYLERGLRLGPNNALLRVHLAEAYLAVNRKEEARKQIDTIIKMKPDPDYLPEYDDAVTLARKLQGKLK